MSYQEALEAAGAEILAFEQFGSYQGDWFAKVSYNGNVFWVKGYYGSCSECDAFEAEFGWGKDEFCDEHCYKYNPPPCEKCKERANDYHNRLAEFGAYYLDDPLTQEQAEAIASRDLEWDSDAVPMLKFVKDNAL